MHFDIDPNEIFRQILGPLGARVFTLLMGAGFAWPNPWFYFGREVREKEKSYEKRITDLESKIVKLETNITDLHNQNRMILTVAQSGTNQGNQAAQLAKMIASLTAGPALPDGG